jgi:hypothetical protein
VQKEEGNFPHRFRDTQPPPVVQDNAALLPWHNQWLKLNNGDWLVGVRVTHRDDLARLVAQFPLRCRVFDAFGYSLGRDGLHGAFLWLQDMQGITMPQDAYLKAEEAIPELSSLSRLIIHNFGAIEIANEMATLDLHRMQAVNVMNVGCRYSNTVMVRVLSRENMKAMKAAPQSENYTSPSWGEYALMKAKTGDAGFAKIVERLGKADFSDLYYVHEIIMGAIAPGNKPEATKIIVSQGWATADELNSFRETANVEHRHWGLQQRPGISPMKFAVADVLIRRLFAWHIADCMHRDGFGPTVAPPP